MTSLLEHINAQTTEYRFVIKFRWSFGRTWVHLRIGMIKLIFDIHIRLWKSNFGNYWANLLKSLQVDPKYIFFCINFLFQTSIFCWLLHLSVLQKCGHAVVGMSLLQISNNPWTNFENSLENSWKRKKTFFTPRLEKSNSQTSLLYHIPIENILTWNELFGFESIFVSKKKSILVLILKKTKRKFPFFIHQNQNKRAHSDSIY